jgi:RNA polymerase sigma-70 factor (ECF subfamily)
MTSDEQARSTADAVARRSYGKLVAFLAARARDVSSVEDALSEAFASALKHWPVDGCPENPEGWLLTAARRKLIDFARKRHNTQTFSDSFSDSDASSGSDAFSELFAQESVAPPSDFTIPDQRLALIFACAHPAIEPTIRAPLILQVLLGLDATRIASAFLVSPAAMSQRLVRAKDKIRQAGIPFRIPERAELPDRLGTVLDAIYGAFSEGWTDTGGDLADEALFLGQLVAELLPDAPEALGLLALMLYVESRRPARRNDQGDYIPLAEQNPSSWNYTMIEAAESLLQRAGTMNDIGRYQLEAALQSAHIASRRSGADNWPDIVHLYDALLALSGSPVVAINRALAVAKVDGAASALQILDSLGDDPRLAQYQPYWAARAELLSRTSNLAAAHEAYEVAIGLERDPAVRRFLQQRQAALEVGRE